MITNDGHFFAYTQNKVRKYVSDSGPWSVMALIRSLHEKKLLPKDDPVISQLLKSFSKACSNVASCITSNTAFVTMKR